MFDHDTIVKVIADRLSEKRYDVKAAGLEDYEEPDTIMDMKPDVVATGRAPQLIIEVESADGVLKGHSAKQWVAFKDHADNQNLKFEVYVENTGITDALELREDLMKVIGGFDVVACDNEIIDDVLTKRIG